MKSDPIYRTGEKALIFDIQRFSLHDGPGIRTVIFFKGCPLRCVWCQNPESLNPYKEIAFYENKCINSGKCITMCKQHSIKLDNINMIDRSTCDACGACADACPSSAIKVVGRYYTAKELLEEVLKDKPFFDQSEGGVTFSGGEPALHHRFLKAFIEMCNKQGIHTAMETCGYFNMAVMQDTIKLVDLILYDIKIFDETKHIKFTGKTNKIIFENLKRLVTVAKNVVPRMPIIPQYTADEENIVSIAHVLMSLGFRKIYLLPYHAMGEAKIKPIGSSQPYLKLLPLSSDELKNIQHIFTINGLETILYGWM